MSSRSSSSAVSGPLPIGKIKGHRGNKGELTVIVASGQADRWERLSSVLVGSNGPEHVEHVIETARSYKDRLVLKLEGLESAGQAAELKGRVVLVRPDQVPALPEGEYYLEKLVGLVVHEGDEVFGTVTDVLESSGTHVLVVHDDAGRELMVPLVREIVKEVDEKGSGIEVVLPCGLRELGSSVEGNRS